MIASILKIIPLDQIEEGKRIRRINEANVQMLMLSMGGDTAAGKPEKLLAQPITVRPKPDGGYLLVIGGHRLETAKRLGWTEIEAVVKDLSDEEALLEEVDENLYRADLTPIDLTLFMKTRLELHSFNGKELRRGRDLRKSANLADLDLKPREWDRYYDEIADKFGIKRRTAERLVRRARNIPGDLIAKIQTQKKAVNGAVLDRIASLEAANRAEVARLVIEDAVKIQEAIKRVVTPVPKVTMSVDQALAHVVDAWLHWSAKDRSRFVKELKSAGKP